MPTPTLRLLSSSEATLIDHRLLRPVDGERGAVVLAHLSGADALARAQLDPRPPEDVAQPRARDLVGTTDQQLVTPAHRRDSKGGSS